MNPPKTLAEPKITATKPSASRQRVGRVRQHQNAAEQNDAVNGVGAGHQRRVQHRGHFGDDFKAHKNREDEDKQDEDFVSIKSIGFGGEFFVHNLAAVRDQAAFDDFIVELQHESLVLLVPEFLDEATRFAE